MNTSELAELIKSRRSIRKWENKPVPEDLLRQAIELATYAANAGNQQNWHFQVILKKSVINSIADAVQATAEQIAAWPEATKMGEFAQRMTKGSAFFRDAPVGVAISASKYQSPIDQALEAREKVDGSAAQIRKWRETADSRIQSVGSGISYFLLIIHQMGLGGVWMTGPMMAKGKIEKILNLPSNLDLVAYIPVGYPAESPALRERKPLAEVCEFIK
jgi:nitroreductase